MSSLGKLTATHIKSDNKETNFNIAIVLALEGPRLLNRWKVQGWLTDCCLPWTLAQYLWKCLSSYLWFYWSAFKVDKKKIHFLSRKHLLIWSWIWFYWFLLVRLNFYQLKIRFLLLHRRRSLSMLNRRSPNSTFITASNEAISCLNDMTKTLKLKSIWLLLWLMQGSLVTLSFKIKLYR